MQNDLTVIFLTANEHPESFTAYHKKKLAEAIGDFPMITVSRQPILDGSNFILDTEPQSHFNMYCQLLKAAKLATTPYVATAESDTLYPAEHFTFYRPPMDAVAYDMSRWIVFTWYPEYFSLKRRISNSTLIAPREYLIECLEERQNAPKAKELVGEIGRNHLEELIGITRRNAEQVWCHTPSIQINHPNGTNYRMTDHPRRKRAGELKAIEIPFWGKAVDIVKEYK